MELTLPSESFWGRVFSAVYFLGLGSGDGPDLGPVLGLGRGGDQRRAQEVVGQWEMPVELWNFVRDDAYFGDGVGSM